MADDRTIYSHALQCLGGFEQLAKVKESSPRSLAEIDRIRKRFEKWCNTLGADVPGLYSLDERLRDASKIKKIVLDCLDGVEDVLQNEIKGNIGAQGSSESPDGDLPDPTSPSSIETRALQRMLSAAVLGEPLRHADAMIDVLFRITVAIRPELSAERYEKAQCIKLSDEDLFIEMDRETIGKLCPNVSPELRERLLSASLQRRRLLQYTKEYREKFIANLARQNPMDTTVPDELDNAPRNRARDPDSDSTISRLSSNFSTSGILNDQDPFPDNYSDVSSVSSLSTSWKYKLPPLPEMDENGYRICEACYLLLRLPDQRSWNRHILKDIRPYVCTFAECTMDQEKLYSSQQAWFEHELMYHRRLWSCGFGCSNAFSSLKDLEGHLHEQHRIMSNTLQLSGQKIMRVREISQNTEIRCPFCAKMKPQKKIKNHMGAHQRQIALMALSSMRNIGPESEEENSDQDSIGELESSDSNPPLLPHASDSTHSGLDTASNLLTSSPTHQQQTLPAEHILSKTDYAGAIDKARTGVGSQSTTRPEKRRPVKHTHYSGLQECLWMLMPNFDHPYPGDLDLGQVLRHPRDFHGFLQRDRLLVVQPGDIRKSVHNEWAMATSVNRAFSTWPISRKVASVTEIYAKHLVTFTFQPNSAYVRELMELLKALELDYSSSKSTAMSSTRFYLIVGVRVGTDCRVAKSERSMSGIKAGVSIGNSIGVELEFSTTADREEGSSSTTSVEGPVVLAYSLVEIKKSWVGNIITTGYVKGDTR